MRCWINHPILTTRHLYSLLAAGRFAHRPTGEWEQVLGRGGGVPHRMIPSASGGSAIVFHSVPFIAGVYPS